MKKLVSASLAIVAIALAGIAQSDLPEIGKLSDLQGKRAVYIAAADSADRERIAETIAKAGLKTVDSPENAEFFVEYRETSRHPVDNFWVVTGRLEAYFSRDGKKVVAFSATGRNNGLADSAARGLAKRFLKEFKAIR